MADGSYVLQFAKHGIQSPAKAGTLFIIQKQLPCHDGKIPACKSEKNCPASVTNYS